MAFNLRNRSFLKEIDFAPTELRYLLKLSEALKRSSSPRSDNNSGGASGREGDLVLPRAGPRSAARGWLSSGSARL
jgi:ornithine carbamoyltransferase